MNTFMKVTSYGAAIGWLAMLVGLFYGFEPSKFAIGGAFFIASYHMYGAANSY